MVHIALVAVLAAATSQPASRPAPDLSRMDAARLRSYAIGLWNRVAYLERQLADAKITNDALRLEVSRRNDAIVGLEKEAARLRVVEQQFRGTPEGQKAAEIENAIARRELIQGMTLAQVERIFGKGPKRAVDGRFTSYTFNDGTRDHICTFDGDRLDAWVTVQAERRFLPAQSAFSAGGVK